MLNIEQLEKRQCLTYGPIPFEPVPSSQPLFPDNIVADFDLETLYQTHSVEGIDFKEMRELISSTDDGGYTDRLEYLQLQRYLRLSDMPEYVRYFTDAALNGHETTTDTIFNQNPEKLLNKWFRGKDLPETHFSYIEVKGELFIDGIDQNDPIQGGLGDCYFITSLGAIAQNNPTAITSMILEVDENIWVVRFYDLYGQKHFVTVNNQLPYVSNSNLKSSVFADWGNDYTNEYNELWPALLEKAYAQASANKGIRNKPNNYTSIEVGDCSRVFQHITNHKPHKIKGIGKNGYVDYISQNKPITTTFNNHTYTFEYYNLEEDKFFVRNPWGYNHLYSTWQELVDLSIVGDRQGGYVFDIFIDAEIL